MKRLKIHCSTGQIKEGMKNEGITNLQELRAMTHEERTGEHCKSNYKTKEQLSLNFVFVGSVKHPLIDCHYPLIT